MNDLLRAMVDLRDRTLQKSRIAFGNRVGAIERGVDQQTNGSMAVLQKWEERFKILEEEADRDIREMASKDAIMEAMTEVKGVGLLMAAKSAAMIDIRRAETISALWRYAGYGVKDGEREKPTKGEKLHYNKRLKTTCYLIGTSFLRSNSPYRKVYDDAREYYEVNRSEWTKGHQHNAAMRKMIKVWLAHLWIVWRELEGLPVSEPYIMAADAKHSHYLKPEDYGWKARIVE